MKYSVDQAIKKGGNYILTEGRLFEQTLYQYHFQQGTLDAVLNELVVFQNEDGGFGHGLECDLQMPASSVLATSEALIQLRSLGVSFHHPMAEKAVGYLLDNYQFGAKSWYFVPKETDQYPRAPWWNFDPDPRAARHNPRPQLLGDLMMGEHLVPGEMLHLLAIDVREALIEDCESLVMHDVLSYLRLYRTPGLPSALAQTLEDCLPRMIDRTVENDPEKWDGYCLRPYQVVQALDDRLLPVVEDALPASIAYLLKEQTETGGWLPTWSWGDQYPAVWEKAKKDWAGVLTLDTLLTLKKFGAMVLS